MGSQILANNDRSRTYWTPAMERYFLNLMLEHTHRGDRVGHTFSKQAWADMLNMFNANFGSQYDMEVLKTHYTNLWKQFNDIKGLLSQNGFSWDETRQMVTAHDYVWDAYIKADPDARSYKTKPVLNFNDLCLIYGYTTADGRYSRSSHDIDIDDELQGIDMGVLISGPVSSGNERLRTYWTPDMDQYFIDLILDQLGRGNKIDNTFNKHAWTEMLSLFNAKFGPQHNKRVLRHRYKKLRKYYTDVTKLLKQKGFFWDETKQSISADDHVWDAYIKAHPCARSYRTKILPDYNDMVLIYGNGIDNGSCIQLHKNNDIEDNTLGIKGGEVKEAQNLIVIERSRTYWTPPMDRYLIDLLLEQVHMGNKFAQTFISQAWIEITASFNAKFKSNHDKEVLKNRYKHLRRQYNERKTLLEQEGFSWDDQRQMVTAKDHVWDAYLKVHPDARSYRVKMVPSYHKLCIIYGQERSDQRYSCLARNADPNNEISLLATGGRNGDQSEAVTDVMLVDSMTKVDHHLIDLMLEWMHSGYPVDQTYIEQAWTFVVASLNQKFGLHYDRCRLEKKYMKLIKEYNDIKSILNQSGFSWDAVQQIIIADDNVWEAYIKGHPDASVYRDKILGNYNDMSLIFGTTTPDVLLGCDKGVEIEVVPVASDVEMDGFSIGPTTLSKDTEQPSDCGRNKRQSKSPTLESSRKFHRASKGRTPEDHTEVEATKKDCKNDMPIEIAVEALQAIPGIDDELLLDACDLLEDDRKAQLFLALDAKLRKKWLLRKLRP